MIKRPFLFQFNLLIIISFLSRVNQGELCRARELLDGSLARERERTRQRAINDIKRKFGKNAVLKGIDLLPGATARERHAQIGGHRSGEGA